MINATIKEAISIVVFIIKNILAMLHYVNEGNDAEDADKKIY